MLSIIAEGLLPLPWWGYIVLTLVLTHITIVAVTIYLHRHQAHRALDLHPIASHFFRFWLWLTTGMVTKEWAAIHRKHHAKCEQTEDPHSPQVYGIRKVFWQGAELYRAEAKNSETVSKYGHGTPDDWIERNLYTKHSALGITLMLILNLVLFGPFGLSIWAVQMVWIPLTAAGIINGIGHFWGYRNYQCEDASRNISPWGIMIGGEELHNNHHAYGTSAKFSTRWYEFDIGWAYIQILSALGLAHVRKVAPKLNLDPTKSQIDAETLQAVIVHRYTVMKRYANALKEAYFEELKALRQPGNGLDALSWKKFNGWLQKDSLAEPEQKALENTLNASKVLNTVYAMRQELCSIWERSSETSEQLLQRLQDWCHRAEASGIDHLQQIARHLRSYRLSRSLA